jgi:hypothetical protein
MRFSLRTLLILMLLAGPLGAWGWKEWQAFRARMAQEEAQLLRRQAFIIRTGSLPKIRKPTKAEEEIWLEQRDRITWESFPESQPPPR